MQLDKKKILIIFGIIIIIITISIFKNYTNKNNYEQLEFNDVISENKIEISNETNKIDEKIKVHIIGEVNNPGLIELNIGSRIYDAIELAGGLTNEADTSKTNLAYILSDGEKIYIPNFNDEDINTNSSDLNSNKKININTANLSELQEIPGVGEATANSIIEYRTKNRKIYFNWRYSKCFRNRSKQIWKNERLYNY